jgi:hypothetical protein
MEHDPFDKIGSNYVTGIAAYEDFLELQAKENADVTTVLNKIGVNNYPNDPSHIIWEKMVRIMLKSGTLKVEDFK